MVAAPSPKRCSVASMASVSGRSSGASAKTTRTSSSPSRSSAKAVSPTATASPVPRCTACSTNSTGTSVSELLLDRLGDVLGAVPHDDDDAIERERGEGVEDVEDHGTAAQRVQHLGRARPHARALAGRGHDGSEWTSTLTGHLALAFSLAAAGLTRSSVLLVRRARWRWLGGEVSNLDLGLQRTPCCRYTTPERRRDPTLGRPAFWTRLCRSAIARLAFSPPWAL